MINLLVLWFLTAITFIITAYFVPGFKVDGLTTALFAAAVVGFFNIFLKPILLILTLPINILTLGLFTFVVNAIVLKISAGLIGGFSIDSWWSAIFGAVILVIVQSLVFRLMD